MKTLRERLRWAREKRKLSYAELDEIADLSCGHSQKIEMGKRVDPSAATISKLAYALNVDLRWLVNGRGKPQIGRS